MEVWKDIIYNEKPTIYEISNYGNVRHKLSKNIKQRIPDKSKPRTKVLLHINNTVKVRFSIPCLVLENFYEHRFVFEDGFDIKIDHINGDVSDCRITNLRVLASKTIHNKNINSDTYRFIDPYGRLIQTNDLKTLCKENKLNHKRMLLVHSLESTVTAHKNWRKHY